MLTEIFAARVVWNVIEDVQALVARSTCNLCAEHRVKTSCESQASGCKTLASRLSLPEQPEDACSEQHKEKILAT